MAETRTNKFQGPIADLIDAMGAQHNAKAKADADLQTAILKMKAMSQVRMQEEKAKQTMSQNTPEQRYLMRRAREENPMMAMAGQDDQTVEFDPSVAEATPTMNNKGLYEQKKLTPAEIEDNKGKAFMAMFNKMAQSGKTPPAWMGAAAEKIQARTNERLGYKKEAAPGGRKPSEIKSYLDFLMDDEKNPNIGTPENDAEVAAVTKLYRQAIGINNPPSEEEAAPDIEKFDEESENTINENMAHYKKTREEVIDALRKKGIL